MGRTYDTLDDNLIEWIGRMPVFFVATAPNDPAGHVNLSPKGGTGTFRVIGPTTVAYLDLIGSGVETIAHLQENGRIVVMFCAFDGPPKIVRLHGRGRVVRHDDPEFDSLLGHFDPTPEVLNILRSIIVVETNRIGDSCGFAVPRMTLAEERQHLFKWAENKEETVGDGWQEQYHRANNRFSIDGVPGLAFDDEEAAATDQRLVSAGRAL
jgi:hypothetical protein